MVYIIASQVRQVDSLGTRLTYMADGNPFLLSPSTSSCLYVYTTPQHVSLYTVAALPDLDGQLHRSWETDTV